MSKKRLFLVILVALIGAVWLLERIRSSGRRNLDPTPPPFGIRAVPFDVPMSHFDLPLLYDVEDFEIWLNKLVQGTFVEHGATLRDGKDSLFIRVRKIAPIELSVADSRLVVKIPLRIKGHVFHNTGKMTIRNLRAIKTDIVLTISTNVKIDQNWRLITNSRLEGITWLKKPYVNVLGARIDLSPHLEKALETKKDVLLRNLDKKLYESVDLSKPIAKVWSNLQVPKPVIKGQPGLWMKFELLELHGEEIQLEESGHIRVEMMVAGRLLFDMRPENFPPSNEVLPPFLPKYQMRRGFDIAIHASLPYDSLSKLLNQRLKNMKTAGWRNTLSIESLNVFGTGDQLAVMTQVNGITTGKLYLLGQPEFHAENQILHLTEFEYDVNTQNALLGLANDVAHAQLRDSVEKHLTVDLGRHLKQVPQLLTTAIEQGKAAKAIDLNVKNIEILSCNFRIGSKALNILIQCRGEGNLALQELKVKKKLKIR